MSAQPAPKLSPDAAGGHWPTILAVPDEDEKRPTCDRCGKDVDDPKDALCRVCALAEEWDHWTER